MYNATLSEVVETPTERPGDRDVYYTYTIRTEHRNALKDNLEKNGVYAKVRDPILMPHQPAYRGFARGCFTNAENWVNRLLCLPDHQNMTDEDAEYVSRMVIDYFRT